MDLVSYILAKNGKGVRGLSGTDSILLAALLRSEPSILKLPAPVIQLMTVSDPVEPEPIKLTAPVIRLEVVEETEPGIPDEPSKPDETTPAILGVAILGRTILGNYDGNTPKLETPVIQLVTTYGTLAAPVIRLEAVDDGGAEPTPDKLDAPTIQIVTVSEPEEPKPPKLDTPVIRLETAAEPDEPIKPDVPEEPDEPVVVKLDAPVIRIEDVIMVLDAPIIELVEV